MALNGGGAIIPQAGCGRVKALSVPFDGVEVSLQ